MARHSDRKVKQSPAVAAPIDPSRRSFIERVVGTSVTAPAFMTLTGSWLAADTVFAAKPTSESSLGSKNPTSSASGPVSGSSHMSGSQASESGSSGGPPSFLHTTADSTLRYDSPNTNEGANPRIRVGVNPLRRGLVQFDPQTVFDMRGEALNGGTVYLTLHIAANGNNWSQTDDHYVDVHPLPPNFWVVEGTGKFTGLPSDQATRGSEAGVTWNAPYDSDSQDPKKNVPKGLPKQWDGGSLLMGDATAPGVLHVNGLEGQVSWDVTQDVLNGANAWIVKVRDEEDPSRVPALRKLGFDPFRPNVDYYSKEGAIDAIGCAFPPQLQLVSFNSCNGGETSTSQSALSHSF